MRFGPDVPLAVLGPNTRVREADQWATTSQNKQKNFSKKIIRGRKI